MQQITDGDAIGPISVGLNKSVHVLQLGCSVREIINMVKVAVIEAKVKIMIGRLNGKLIEKPPQIF